MSANWQSSPKKETELRPYPDPLELLTEEDKEFFRDRYGLGLWGTGNYILRAPVTGRYALPIFDPSGQMRGHVLRHPWIGAPLDKEMPHYGKKAYTFMSAIGPVQSWYVNRLQAAAPALVLVEDQLSAMKLWQQGLSAVALLGVPNGGEIGMDRIAEITRAPASEVVIALDADATENAFAFARKWGSAFRKLRVAILSKDIKDTPNGEIREVLGL